MNSPLEADAVITSVAQLINSAGWELDSIPGLIKRIIAENMWPERVVRMTGEVVRFRTFAEFVTTAPPSGLGTRIETLERVCKEDAETITLLRQATTRPVGSNQHTEGNNNIITQSSPQGTSRAYTLDRLSRERPDLYEQVKEKKLSANAAAIEAGWRKRAVSVQADPDAAVAFILRHFTEDERAYIVRALLGLEAQS